MKNFPGKRYQIQKFVNVEKMGKTMSGGQRYSVSFELDGKIVKGIVEAD